MCLTFFPPNECGIDIISVRSTITALYCSLDAEVKNVTKHMHKLHNSKNTYRTQLFGGGGVKPLYQHYVLQSFLAGSKKHLFSIECWHSETLMSIKLDNEPP